MKEILTLDELKDFTGLKQIKRIREWLEEYGIPYLPTPSGIPRVHKLALAHKMGAPINDPGNINGLEPDLSKVS